MSFTAHQIAYMVAAAAYGALQAMLIGLEFDKRNLDGPTCMIFAAIGWVALAALFYPYSIPR